MSHRWLYWIPVCLHMGLIFFLSSRPQFPVEAPPIPFIDKAVHMLLFGLLAFLFLWGWTRGQLRRTPPAVFLYAIVFTAVYGMTDEIHQAFVPNRTPDLLDWLADVAGATLVCGAVLVRNAYMNAFGVPVEERSSENP